MATTCFNGVPAPSCDLTCEELECRLDAIDANITNLFNRTNQINNYLGTTSGSTGGWRVVTNEEELLAAASEGGMILIVGEIELTAGIEFVVPGTQVYGRPDSEGNPPRLILPHVPDTTQTIVTVSCDRFGIFGIELTTGWDPLGILPIDGFGNIIPGTGLDWGIRINTSAINDISDLTVDRCYIHHVSTPLVMQGGQPTHFADRLKITNNRFESFNYYGVLIDYNTRDLLIENNWIWGRANTELTPGQSYTPIIDTHPVRGNCLWLGNYLQRAVIRNNDIARCDRHGLEIWNDFITNEANANDSILVEGNNLHDLDFQFGSFAISVIPGGGGVIIANNFIRNVTGYGIEIFNAENSQGKTLIIGNNISNIIGAPGSVYIPLGMSINSSTGCLITGNYINNVRSSGAPSQYGINLTGGASGGHPDQPGDIDITIMNNQFVDAGNLNILVGGVGPGVLYQNIVIQDNVFKFTEDRNHNAYEAALYLSFPGLTNVVRNNVLFHPTADPIGTSPTGFDLVNGGTVYRGDATELPIVWTGNPTPIDGTNLTIEY